MVFYAALAAPAADRARRTALALALAVLVVNALWNLFFFRTRNLFHAFCVGVAYSALSLGLLLVLRVSDPFAATWFVPYAAYLVFGNWWGYRIWQWNKADAGRARNR